MKAFTAAVAILTASATLASAQGKYQGVATGGSREVWIVDTETGQVKYCSSIGNKITCIEE